MLIKCPECGKDVSDKATNCIHCGYPLQPVRKPQEIPVAPPVRKPQEIPATPKSTKRSAMKRCSKCGAIYPADDKACPSCGKAGGKTMKVIKARAYADEKPAPNIKCPTCGSTDVERISTMAKAVDIWAFGLFGNKRNKQFKCNTCRYMW